MVAWYVVSFSMGMLVYLIPKRFYGRAYAFLSEKAVNFYTHQSLGPPTKTVVAICDDLGMNFEKVRLLCKEGARIILGGQDKNKMETIRNELVKTTKNKNITIIFVDRNDKESILKFSKQIISTTPKVDVIINNEGFSLNSLDINFKTQTLAKERFENHCCSFLYDCEDLKNYKLKGWYH